MRGKLTATDRNKVLLAWFLLAVSFACISSTSGATEEISIQTLLAQAPSYELQIVRLRGVARGIELMPPLPAVRGCKIYGRATFVLEDETGSLPVEVLGRSSCLPGATDFLPKEGDRIILTAQIYLSKDQLPVKVWAQASEIQLVPDSSQ
jgi:hypothetical protein